MPQSRLASLCVVVSGSLALAVGSGSCVSRAESIENAEAFATVARVLRHPRCLNCHPSGDRPYVGDERRVHPQLVQRGEDGFGMFAMRCDNCHQDENQELANVPGAPRWHLAPRSMGWEEFDDHDLADQLKDRERNGDKTLEQLLEHIAKDPLVLWGWNPGPGREAVPMPHAAFVRAFRNWIDAGAISPRPGTKSTF